MVRFGPLSRTSEFSTTIVTCFLGYDAEGLSVREFNDSEWFSFGIAARQELRSLVYMWRLSRKMHVDVAILR